MPLAPLLTLMCIGNSDGTILIPITQSTLLVFLSLLRKE